LVGCRVRGLMVTAKLKNLIKDHDRHGNLRYYVRCPGQPKIRIHAAYVSTATESEGGTSVSRPR
jgi:hypothetical protein